MRIILVCGAGHVSGKELMTLTLAKGLKERGHECYCITSDWGKPDFRRRLTEIRIPYSQVRIGFISKTLSWRAIWMTLDQLFHVPALYIKYRKIIKSVKPDIVIHTNFHHVFMLYPILADRGQIYWSHEIIISSSFYKKLFIFFTRKVSAFIGVSNAVTSSIQKLLKDDVLVTTIHNGIEEPDNFKASKKEALIFAIVGRIDVQKGHALLVKALPDILSHGKKIELLIFGEGDENYKAELISLSESLNIHHLITWKGFERNINLIYENVDVLVVPSMEYESYPTTIMEAGLRGIPVVASDVGGIPEMIVDNVNGFIFKAGDLEAIKYSLNQLFIPGILDRLRVHAREHAYSHFTIHRFIDKFDNVFLKMNQP